MNDPKNNMISKYLDKKLKKFITTALLTFLSNIVCFSQRRPSKRSFEVIGLPDTDNIAGSLTIAIPLLIFGFLIAYIFMWSKKDKDKIDNVSTNIGCFGIIIMGVGAFFLLPLLAWFEFIFSSLLSIGIAIVVVVAIIFIIYSIFTSKKND